MIALEKFPQNENEKNRVLDYAHELQKESLQIAINNFGENSLQTAKHYGNLGRLYQSMDRKDEAEKMHLKAISIKESLLGGQDSEVAVSLGHLASLYNYDMEEYGKAEILYHRCINICKDLFGASGTPQMFNTLNQFPK